MIFRQYNVQMADATSADIAAASNRLRAAEKARKEKEEKIKRYKALKSAVDKESNRMSGLIKEIDKCAGAINSCGEIGGNTLDNGGYLNSCKSEIAAYTGALSNISGSIAECIQELEES